MRTKIILLAIGLSLNLMHAAAQTWQLVGIDGFSTPVTQYSLTGFTIDHNGTPYVAYSDASNSDKITVMKFDGLSWVLVGNAGFSTGSGYDVSIAVNSANVPYVAFGDAANASKTTVMKFNGTSWINVGLVGFSDGTVNNCTIRFNSSDTAYVSYVDASYSGKAVVKKFNGTSWVNVGNPGITAGGTGQMTMALNANSAPYIAYQDQANGFAASCMMFNGSSWVHVGSGTFSASVMQFAHIAFDHAGITPYVCYNAGSGTFSPNLQMYNGSSWVYVGPPNFNNNQDYQNNLALDGNDIPYVIFPDGLYSSKASVMKYFGSSWVYVGNTGFSTGSQIWYPNIAVDAQNNVYVEFYDDGNLRKISVYKFEITTAINEIDAHNNVFIYPNPASNQLTIQSQPGCGNYELEIMNNLGQKVYQLSSAQLETIIDVSDWSTGVYFMRLKTDKEIITKKFVKE